MKISPPAVLFRLVMKIHILLINLVMVLAVGAHRQVRVEDDAAILRAEESGVCVAHGCVEPQTMNIDGTDPRGNAIQF